MPQDERSAPHQRRRADDRRRAMSALIAIAVVSPVVGAAVGLAWSRGFAYSEEATLRVVLTLTASITVASLVTLGAAAIATLRRTLDGYETNVSDAFARNEQLVSELERLNRTLDEFTARVAHDVRSPLGSILMATELLSSDPTTVNPLLREATDVIVRSARHGTQLVDELLQLARASGTPRRESISLAEVARQAAAETSGLELVSAPEGAEIVADRVAVRRALENLFRNAVAYAASDGVAKVSVECEQSPAGWVVSVADNGPGLPAAEATAIFEPFRRGTTGSAVAGTGLGLAIVATVAEAHGGHAWYEPRDGGGARFRFLLAKSASPELRVVGPAVSSASAPSSRIPQGAA